MSEHLNLGDVHLMDDELAVLYGTERIAIIVSDVTSRAKARITLMYVIASLCEDANEKELYLLQARMMDDSADSSFGFESKMN